jgi:hypothetical protein
MRTILLDYNIFQNLHIYRMAEEVLNKLKKSSRLNSKK